MLRQAKIGLLIGLLSSLLFFNGSASADEMSDLKAEMARQQAAYQAQMQAMLKRLEALESNVAAESSSAVAGNGTPSSGNQKIKLAISGQVNRGILYGDNGDLDEFFHVDNDNSSTRIRLVGEGKLNDDITVGTNIEVQFESNSTADIRFGQDSPAGANNFTERKLELYADSKTFGRVTLGQGDTATNGTSEVDLSGTSVVAYSGIADMAGGLAFSENNVLGPRINETYSNFDGLSRDDRVRYDTPGIAGFKLSTSAVDGGSYDVALRYAGEFGGLRVAAAAGYADANSRQGFDQVNGSVSVKMANGLNATIAAGQRDVKGNTGDDPVFYYGKLGYIAQLFEIGSTAVSIDFAAADDLNQQGDEFTAYGIFAVQRIDPVAAELYLGIRNHELDRAGSNYDDVLAVLTGARVKF